MIVTNIQNCAAYSAVHPDFATAFAFLRTLTPDTAPGPVSYETMSATVVVLTKADPKETDGQPWLEAHRKYIDIHYIVEGEERFGYADIGRLQEATAYSSETDCLFCRGALSPLTLRQGDICIVYPEDAHAPAMPCGGNPAVKRVVIKIAV